MNKNLAILLTVVGLLISCSHDEADRNTELIGTWHGVGYVIRSIQNGESVSYYAPYFVAFAYDNGVNIQANGSLSGKCAENLLKPRATSWDDCYVNEGNWSLSDDLLTLNNVEYKVLSLTSDKLIIWRQVNSDSSNEITLEKQ